MITVTAPPVVPAVVFLAAFVAWLVVCSGFVLLLRRGHAWIVSYAVTTGADDGC